MAPTMINPEGSEFDVDGRITSVASGGDVIAYVLATADPPTGAVDITFVDLTDGARARRAAFAAAMACALVAL